MPRSPAEAQPPLSERLPIVTYTNAFRQRAETVWMSPQVERLFGYRLEEWVDNPGFFETILHPDDRAPVLAEMRRSRDELQPFSRDYRVIGRDGRVRWIHDESVPIVAEGGGPEFIQGYFIDVTERKELERELLQSQKREALGRLAAGIAHDFSNFLTAIGGYAEVAKRTLGTDAPAHRPLVEIAKTVERAARLTRQLLAFSRSGELGPQSICLGELVNGAESMLRHVAGPTVTLRIDVETTIEALADPAEIEHVLMNLVANARDAGASRVEVSTADAGHGHVALTVTDNGSGMDEETLSRVFDPFFTTKGRDEGTGLGLSLAHSVIRQLGGAIEVESAPEAGTTFRILLPVAKSR